MPILKRLAIQNFRNLESVDLVPNPHFNFLYGKNGSGKTSFLEALHYLGVGRSFRAQHFACLIQQGTDRLSISADLHLSSDHCIPLGVERSRQGQRHLRMDCKNLQGWAPIAEKLPFCTLTAMGPRFLYDGSRIRRRFMDWLLFHVEPSFFQIWQRFQHALRNRNACLKDKYEYREMITWNKLFCTEAYYVDSLRKRIVDTFKSTLEYFLNHFLPHYSIEIHYEQGWDAQKPLEHLLEIQYKQDRTLGYTQSGPQRADLKLTIGKNLVLDILSLGQQKLVHYALYLAQGRMIKEMKNISPIYLVDDLSAELDEDSALWVLQALAEMQAQTFITDIHDKPSTSLSTAQRFHVEHGKIFEV